MNRQFLIKSFVLLGTLIGTASISFASDHKKIKVNLISSSTQSKASGTVAFIERKDKKILVKGVIKGLSPGQHGLHIHEVGDCSDPEESFVKSGKHFNPESTDHGGLLDGHSGDLGNIVANADGKATFKFEVKKFNLIAKDKNSILDRALVVHSGKDDEKTNPAGNSGARVLCGVIRLSQ